MPPLRPLLAWPSYLQLRTAFGIPPGDLLRQARLLAGVTMARRHRDQLEAALQNMPHWRSLFLVDSRSFEPLVHSFVDRRLRTSERFDAIAYDLRMATTCFGVPLSQRLARGESVMLWRLPRDGRIELSANMLTKREGFWALRLVTDDEQVAFHCSFSFTAGGVITVAGVQGARMEQEVARELIRRVTKAAHGLRPPYLLFEVLRALAQRWQQRLAGVDPRWHTRRRWHHDTLRVAFDYAGFWRELGGVRHSNGVWHIPVNPHQRALSDVPSKRRAEYRRRLEMLEAMPGLLPPFPQHVIDDQIADLV